MNLPPNPNPTAHLSPNGLEPFKQLPCCYGTLEVPKTSVLTGMALCQMTLPPFGESRDLPEEKGHYHTRTTEIYCFTQGSGRMLLNGHWQDVRRGSVLLVPPMVMHTVSASAEGVTCLVWTIPAYDPDDMKDLFDYPKEFTLLNPAWVKAWPETVPDEPLVIHELFETPEYEFGFVQLTPHEGVPLHRHACKEEAYFIVSGSAKMILAAKAFTVAPGHLVSIPEGIQHSITAGPDGVSYLEAGVNLPLQMPE